MRRGTDHMTHIHSSQMPPLDKLRLAILVQAIWDTEAVLRGRFSGFTVKELYDFWCSSWASELSKGADLRKYAEDLEVFI